MRRLRMASTAAIALALMVGCGDDVAPVDGGGGTDAGGDRDSGPPVDSGMPVDSGSDGGAVDGGGVPAACVAPIPALRAESIVGDARFAAPLYVAQPPGSTDLYVVERAGKIRLVRDGSVLETPFLDIVDQMAGTPSGGDEWGLLGLAFHPEYATNGRYFVTYTPRNGDNILAEGQRSAADPDVADDAVTPILTIDDFAANHNGGMITFGPDGFLYYGTGDGGGGGDPQRTAQDLGDLLGKLLRLDVSTPGMATAPPSNPFVEVSGAREEIWAYGLRNPWRFSFDRATDDLYMGDVGQDVWEEIDFASPADAPGANYGWSRFEGTHDFSARALEGPSPHHPPIYEYSHDEGVSVVGGYVYRGAAIPDLRGAYLFADSYSDFVRAMRICDGAVTLPAQNVPGLTRDVGGGAALVSFAQDNAGELYVVYLGSGEVLRIVAD